MKQKFNYWKPDTKVKIKMSKTKASILYEQMKSIQLGQLDVNTEQLKAMVEVVTILKNLIK